MGEVLTSKYSLHMQYGMSYVVYIECYFWHYESEYNRYFNIRQLVSVLNPSQNNESCLTFSRVPTIRTGTLCSFFMHLCSFYVLNRMHFLQLDQNN